MTNWRTRPDLSGGWLVVGERAVGHVFAHRGRGHWHAFGLEGEDALGTASDLDRARAHCIAALVALGYALEECQ